MRQPIDAADNLLPPELCPVNSSPTPSRLRGRFVIHEQSVVSDGSPRPPTRPELGRRAPGAAIPAGSGAAVGRRGLGAC